MWKDSIVVVVSCSRLQYSVVVLALVTGWLLLQGAVLVPPLPLTETNISHHKITVYIHLIKYYFHLYDNNIPTGYSSIIHIIYSSD